MSVGEFLIWAAFGLAAVLIVEGAAYALFAERMRAMLLRVADIPPATLRTAGLVGVVVGLAIVWALGRW